MYPVPINDQPAQVDLLNIQRYSQALKEMVLHPGLRPPLTLGIFGSWGTGKTTLMEMLRKAIHGEGVATVWFDAWRYNQEDALWAAFLQSILNQIGKDLPLIDKPAYYLNLFYHRIDAPVAAWIIAKAVFKTLLSFIPIILAWPIIQQIWGGIYAIIAAVAGGLLTVALAWWAAVSPLLQAVRKNMTIDFSKFWKKSEYKEHLAFLDNFREEFKGVVESLPAKSRISLVVFIDDLDRCSPDKILQVLDAMKLFLDIPGCFFVVGMDERAVLEAVAQKYEKSTPEAHRQYLEKIIQLRFLMPVYSQNEIQTYISKLPYQFQDSRSVEVFAAGLGSNPREIKRTINLFAFSSYLARHQNLPAGALDEVRLAKVVAIQHSYPDLYDVLRRKPVLLPELEAYFQKKAKTAFPDHLLALHDCLAGMASGDLQILADRFGSEKIVPAEMALQAAEEAVLRLERENRLSDLFDWREKVLRKQDWSELEKQVDAARLAGNVPLPTLDPLLLPFRSSEPLNRLFLSGEADAGACFRGLEAPRLEAYFSLTQAAQALSSPSSAVKPVETAQAPSAVSANGS